MTPREIAAENIRRCADAIDDYDPITGRGATGDRIEVSTPVDELPHALVPRTMVDDPQYAVATDSLSWRRLRCRHDFEYWCVTCVLIKPKTGYTNIPLRLNRAQRKVLAVLEADRLAGRPMRIIVLKARQWGCSTLIQNYMAWIQICHRTGWNSLICCHKKDCAVNIRRLYSDLISRYPIDMADNDLPMKFKPFEGSANVREITGRDCRIAVASSDNQDAIRGYDIAMAHLSETAFWRRTPQHDPDDIIRSVCGSIDIQPYTLVAMESTANGVGNFFHKEWQRAVSGDSDKRPVFVAWFEIDFYATPLDTSAEAFAETLNDYEIKLWRAGCTLEQINWYRLKARSYADISKMQAEYPSTDTEAFAATDTGVFDRRDIARLQAGCCKPQRLCRVVGDNIIDYPDGELQIWSDPQSDMEYVVAVDIGGRTATSDWSVIAVLRVCHDNSPHEIVAQWRGHVDHDILVDIACVIAGRYNEALLIIESNSLESEANAGAGANAYVLDRLESRYSNLYYRRPDAGSGRRWRIGFHTNRATKVAVIDGLIRALRENEYIERSDEACYEFAVYRQQENGSYAAEDGYHDDILMTRALALHAAATVSPPVSVPPLDRINRRCW